MRAVDPTNDTQKYILDRLQAIEHFLTRLDGSRRSTRPYSGGDDDYRTIIPLTGDMASAEELANLLVEHGIISDWKIEDREKGRVLLSTKEDLNSEEVVNFSHKAGVNIGWQ